MLNTDPPATTPFGFIEKNEVGVVVPTPTLPPVLPPMVANNTVEDAVRVLPKNDVPLTKLLPCTLKSRPGVVVPTPTLPPAVANTAVEVAVRVDPKYPVPDTYALPCTEKTLDGVVVPTPTLPDVC